MFQKWVGLQHKTKGYIDYIHSKRLIVRRMEDSSKQNIKVEHEEGDKHIIAKINGETTVISTA